MATSFVKFTRLFKSTEDNTGYIKPQKITIAASAVSSVRPSNVLDGQRSTITMTDGTEFALADTYSAVQKALGVRN